MGSSYFKVVTATKVPHNTFVTYFAERGVLGIFLFMMILIVSVRKIDSIAEFGFIT